MYLYVKDQGFSFLSSLTSSLVFMFSGWFVKRVEIIPHIVTLAWLPLIFFFYERIRTSKNPSRKNIYILLTGLIIGIQMLSSHPLFLHCLLALILYSLFITLIPLNPPLEKGGTRGDFTPLEKGGLKGDKGGFSDERRWKPLVFALAPIIIGSSISAIQLLPAYEYSLYSTRADVDYNFATQLSLPIKHLATIFVPYLFGNPNENNYWGTGFFWISCLYTGIFSVMLSLWAILSDMNNSKTQFFALLAFLSLLFSLGNYTPFYYLVYYLPMFNKLRYPSMFISLYVFSLAYLSGRGLDVSREMNADNHRVSFWRLFLFFSMILILLFITLLLMSNHNYLLSWFLPYLKPKFMRETLSFFFKLGIRTPERYLFLPTFFIATSLILLILLRFSSIPWGKVTYLVFFFLLLDLFLFGEKKKPLTISTFYQVEPQTVRFLKKDKDIFRIWADPIARADVRSNYNYNFQTKGYGSEELRELLRMKSMLPYNFPMVYRLFHVVGYDSIKPGLYKDYGLEAERQFVQEKNSTLLDLLNTKYILTNRDFDMDNLELIRAGTIKIYQNKNYLPRAFFVNKIKVIEDEKKILKLMVEKGFNPKELLFLEKPPPFQPSGNISKNEVSIVEFKANHIVLQAKAEGKTFLLLSEVFHPGWKAYVDGKRQEIYKGDYLFRALPLDEGSHEVKFVYRPISFRIGLYISIMSSFLFIFSLFYFLRKSLKR